MGCLASARSTAASTCRARRPGPSDRAGASRRSRTAGGRCAVGGSTSGWSTNACIRGGRSLGAEGAGGEALHQDVEQRLRLGVDPVEILEDDKQGLDLALSKEKAFDPVEGPLAALWRSERVPLG